jgi:hemolysin III
LEQHKNQKITAYSQREELANIFTHGLGLIMSLPAVAILVMVSVRSGDPWQWVSFTIFGLSVFVLYFFSTAYHSANQPHIKQKLRLYDHAAIFVLIAGTYTPFLLIHLRGPWGWSMMAVIWGLALAGIALKMVFGTKYRKLSLTLYLLMGWLCVFAFKEMYTKVPSLSFSLLVTGGLLYTLGVVFYNRRRMTYHHAIWHVFVLGGSTFHYFAVLLSV